MFDRINQDIKAAMKAKETEKLQALRFLKSKLIENKTSKKPIAEQDVVIAYFKKTKDSLSAFPDGHEQKKKIEVELSFLEVYMPEQLDEAKVRDIIEKIKSSLDNPNMGAVMKELSPQIKGKFDGRRASELVKELLA